jgi:hypothetical protein
MKLAVIGILLLITGCATKPVPVKQNFPIAPDTLLEPCPDLKKLEKEVKLSDVAKVVVENYTLYHECSIKSQAWAEWYKVQKKIFEDVK